jgi:peptidoglycan-N-acetylglucosamine deacetylase
LAPEGLASGIMWRMLRPALTALAPHLPAVARIYDIPLRLPESGGVVLSFDDGPHPEGTPAVLEALAAAGERAMFFLVGEQVQRRPRLAAEIAAAGHEVALHGYRHRLQLKLSPGEVEGDLAQGAAVLAEATGVRPRWHRPPYGVYSPAGLRAVHAAAMQPLLWSRWGKDWRGHTTPQRIARRASRALGTGDVILLHDADYYSARRSFAGTVAALPAIIETLKSRGLGTVLPV